MFHYGVQEDYKPLEIGKDTFNSYTMGTSGLPDIYTQSPRAEGVYIRRTTSAHGITTM